MPRRAARDVGTAKQVASSLIGVGPGSWSRSATIPEFMSCRVVSEAIPFLFRNRRGTECSPRLERVPRPRACFRNSYQAACVSLCALHFWRGPFTKLCRSSHRRWVLLRSYWHLLPLHDSSVRLQHRTRGSEAISYRLCALDVHHAGVTACAATTVATSWIRSGCTGQLRIVDVMRDATRSVT